jgi:hypothetical protein
MEQLFIGALQPSAWMGATQKIQRDYKNWFDFWTKTATIKTMAVVVRGYGGEHYIPMKDFSGLLNLTMHLSRLETIELIIVGTRDWGDKPHVFKFD